MRHPSLARRRLPPQFALAATVIHWETTNGPTSYGGTVRGHDLVIIPA
ncbi:hypothetical protein HMPREF9582_02007 [Cutibacterium acnes HL060PA1]|uniref:Limonene-1,2-epoxide hydrolase n=1 Tax=Cutibacterium acnes TaxID=1747 RepID=A0AA44ZEF3_CUTAC|nr:hypothetical protein HMPREF9603_00723 [Cutibacterium acnes HL001PA1]EFT10319.1 hypothetical protein HMPREF9619_01309 [Cutibacterium acnes HL082PA2]EFT26079.1 hypothetical protein HMPREF9577_01351 [Cutibacterium acnes HL110PA3]EFT62873.1 hypothetical protein HMPREF9578_01959 [Cutibacterium acnes HL110PA4]EFT67086.1 hypothetical protein HMPREF9582_02007 [Cutibacterium acnes HL060PA1]EFT76315.1 hypothetical protein HMPREF9599_02441 [Cutibacterium acnes HL050PA2]EGE69881.1 hypothetical protein